MNRPSHILPAILVGTTLIGTLFAGPRIVSSLSRAEVRSDVVKAAARLETVGVLEAISAAQRDLAVVVEPSVVHVSSRGTFGGPRQFSMASSGSGWIWDEAGHIVTNAHVVERADRIEVQLFDGEVREGEVVGLDLRSDIAVVKVPAGDLIPARRGDSRDVQQGDLVYAFGSPFDFRFSMSSGIVSGLGRSAGLEDIDFENFIQVDAAINPGNSGGPLSDVKGRVIGMNTAIATGRPGGTTGQGQFAGIGLAIPLSQITNVVEQVIETGEVRKGYLGVGLLSIGPGLQRSLEAGGSVRGVGDALRGILENYEGEGVAINRVMEGSPADRAGIELGDIVEFVDGRRVRGLEQLQSMISSRRPGDRVVLGVWRLDEDMPRRLELEVVLDEMEQSINRDRVAQGLRNKRLWSLATSTPARAEKLGVRHLRGVMVMPVEDDRFGDPLLPVGTIIEAVDGIRVGTLDELYERMDRKIQRERRPSVLLEGVQPDGTGFQIEIPI